MSPDEAPAPRATYRLQLGPGLDFAAAAALSSYLAALGVTHVYCSPVLQPRAGSTHGYDVADPRRLSAALGGEDGFRQLADAARSSGLGLVVDHVPNHLGTGPDNPLWEQLLAEGPSGPGAEFFDIDWTPALPGAERKVILPVLGSPYGEALFAGEITVVDERGGPRVRYHDHTFPVSSASQEALARSGAATPLAGTPGRPETWARLHALLEEQHYRLVHWRAGIALVNYRRFFAIDELAAVRVEEPAVFDHVHEKILELVRTGLIAGLRLDHVDGLTDPAGYLARLREATGPSTWVVVEKILAAGETLPAWPVAGTTGYDFLADVVGLFVDPAAERCLTDAAVACDAWPADGEPRAGVRRAKWEALEEDLGADSERLVDRFWALTQRHLDVRDITRSACRAALLGIVAALGVYRLYTLPGQPASAQDAARLRAAVAAARTGAADVPGFLWDFLERFLSGRVEGAVHGETLRRFHQLSAAAMAKGVEDTFVYRQHRLVALNDVGVEPTPFGSTVAAFHAANACRGERHPEGMLTTATHDTKRGEDVRLRIAALSEIPGLWSDTVRGWRERHRKLGREPDPATAYLCYQTLVGVWPPGGAPDLDGLRGRVSAYLVKAARENGLRTSWVEPHEPYERRLEAFVAHLLDPVASADFQQELAGITRRVGEIAVVSSLSQVLLRTTSPGVPDTYQGMELWDDSLVDPDNRRPVDFAERRRLLEALDRDPVDPDDLVARRADGRIKLWVLSRSLRARAAAPGCFGPEAGYEPLATEGRFADRVVAFARTGPGGAAAVVVAPRLVGAVMGEAGRPPLGVAWEDTRVTLPRALAGRRWADALGGAGAPTAQELRLADVLGRLPVALLVSDGP